MSRHSTGYYYLRGSSRCELGSLEKTLASMPMPVTHNGHIDPDLTNRARVAYLTEQGLRPVLAEGNLVYYRVIQRDEEGILKIRYIPVKPDFVEPVNEHEQIPISMAAEIYRIMESQLAAMIKAEKRKAGFLQRGHLLIRSAPPHTARTNRPTMVR